MLRITEIFAFCSKDETGDEGVIGFMGPDNSWMPMVGADMERVKSLHATAVAIGKAAKSAVILKTFRLKSAEVIFNGEKEL